MLGKFLIGTALVACTFVAAASNFDRDLRDIKSVELKHGEINKIVLENNGMTIIVSGNDEIIIINRRNREEQDLTYDSPDIVNDTYVN